jgi:(p)ppGpp synthase/HD superfamily hydrolase
MNQTWSQESYIKALRYAADAHNGQLWPGTDLPYLVHLSMVAMEVIAAVGREGVENPDLAVQCALLHDVVEDQGRTREQLVEEFGEAVAAGVVALTKNEDLAKSGRMADSLARIREQPREVWIVKMADRVANLQPAPSHWSADKKRGYRDEAHEILDRLGEASAAMASRLQAKIDSYDVK